MLKLTDIAEVDRIVAIDIETTGHQPMTRDAVARMPKGMRMPGIIIQIGCVELLRDGAEWVKGATWETLVNPDAPIRPTAIGIHGIKHSALGKAPRFPAVVDELRAITKDSTLLAHDAWNEIGYLNYEMIRAKLVTWDELPYTSERFVDTQQMADDLFPGAPRSLDRLLDRLWVDRSDRFKGHGALLDADLTADAFMKMSGGFVIDGARMVSVGYDQAPTLEMPSGR
jgi:DNA polymerase-3 subunit epsilon